MPSEEICLYDVTALAEQIRNRALSPVEVLDAFLERIELLDPVINAFCLVRADEARVEAARAEAEVMQGRPLGPLHGIPLAIKDLTWTKGIRTTMGSAVFRDFIPDADAIHVERSKEAGAIVLGKTQTPEFGHTGLTRNLLFGATVNPWDLTRTCGGSSGGSAAAVAAALAPAADGSDAGGSIRAPASCCGIYGLKPQFGRIPNAIGFENLFDTMVCSGPMTWTVRDAALLLSVWAGGDERDPFSLPFPPEDYVSALTPMPRGTRIAYSPDLGIGVEEDVDEVIRAAVGRLEELGCKVDEIDLPVGEAAGRAWTTWYQAYFSSSYGRYVSEHGDEMTRYVVGSIGKGAKLTSDEFAASQVARSECYKQVRRVFAEYDFLVTPTLRRTPPTADRISAGPDYVAGRQADPIIGWSLTWLFNLTTHPAASIPVGFTPAGLPVGLQIVGPRFAEERVLALSAQIEEASRWHERRPAVASPEQLAAG